MKTFAELKAFCEKNNVKFELRPHNVSEHLNIVTGEWEPVVIGWFFGMNNIAGRKGKSEYNWTWFESIGEKYDENTVFFFSERYSQLNGKSYKGANESWNAEQTINRRMAAIA